MRIRFSSSVTVALVGMLCIMHGFLCQLHPARADRVLYECLDASGHRIFTDNPAQLDHCTVLKEGGANSAASPDPPARMRSTTVQRQTEPETTDTQLRRRASSSDVTIPLERVGHLFVISSRVNDSREVHLILDTGASHTILFPDLASDLGLLPDPQAQMVTLKTAGGPVQARMVQVESIRLAEAEVKNSLAAVYELPDLPPGVEGLLGLSFLSQFEVTVDAARNQLHLRHPGK